MKIKNARSQYRKLSNPTCSMIKTMSTQATLSDLTSPMTTPASSKPPDEGTGSSPSEPPRTPVTTQPSNEPPCEETSYERCVREGKNDRWYYPWDKDMCRMCWLMCMWFGLCLVFPCSLCISWCRDIICCVDEGQWDNTCFGACICGIPIGRGRRRVRHDSIDTYGSVYIEQ